MHLHFSRSVPATKKLVNLLNTKTDETRQLNEKNADAKQNISQYKNKIEEIEYSINKDLAIYEKSIQNEPTKPKPFVNIISFGLANTIYQYFYDIWEYACIDTINQHDFLIETLSNENHKISQLELSIKKHENTLNDLNKQIIGLKSEIQKETAKDEAKIIAIKRSLPELGKLLKEAKRNIEFSLDNNLIKAVN